MQRTYLARAGLISLVTAEAYADVKAERDDCEIKCREQGISFQPVVAETFGGWCAGAQRVFAAIARARALRAGLGELESIELLYQQLAVTLQRGNVLGMLEQSGEVAPDPARMAAEAALCLALPADAGDC